MTPATSSKQPAVQHHHTLSIMLTPIAVLLTGVKSLPSVLVGIILLGILPTPVWVQLLPWIQEESTILFPDTKRHLNDTIASIYNSSMTLGQLVGYTIGPLNVFVWIYKNDTNCCMHNIFTIYTLLFWHQEVQQETERCIQNFF